MNIFKKITVIIVLLQCIILPCMSVIEAAGTYNNSSISDSQGMAEPKTNYKPLAGPNYPLGQDSYFTDDMGNILMIINIIGEVNKPGQIVVQEDADFSAIISLAGGLKEKANLKKVLVTRKEPDINGMQSYSVNLKNYFEKGDRSSFIVLKPNDTIIIPTRKGLTLEAVAKISSIMFSGYTAYSIIRNF
jgi:hypothetical protein